MRPDPPPPPPRNPADPDWMGGVHFPADQPSNRVVARGNTPHQCPGLCSPPPPPPLFFLISSMCVAARPVCVAKAFFLKKMCFYKIMQKPDRDTIGPHHHHTPPPRPGVAPPRVARGGRCGRGGVGKRCFSQSIRRRRKTEPISSLPNSSTASPTCLLTRILAILSECAGVCVRVCNICTKPC